MVGLFILKWVPIVALIPVYAAVLCRNYYKKVPCDDESKKLL